MKIQCDVCNKEEASVFCTADEAAICDTCDHRVHHANKLASKHLRFPLLLPSPKTLPLCDVCLEKRAFLFCQQDRAILCRDCDVAIHSVNEHTQRHHRYLLTGTKLSATSALYVSSNGGGHLVPDSSKPPSKPPVKKHVSVTSASLNPPSMTKPLSSNTDVSESSDNLIPSEGNCSTSSISEYLIEMLPGWHVEEFLDSPSSSPLGFSQRDDDSILSFGGCAFGNNSEESLRIWVPQASTSSPSSQHNCPQMGGQHGFKETKEDTNDLRGNRRLATDDAYTVPQISPQSNASNRPFWPF